MTTLASSMHQIMIQLKVPGLTPTEHWNSTTSLMVYVI